MNEKNSRLAALRSAMTTQAGQTSIMSKPKSQSKSQAEKIEVQPLPITVLAAKAFTGTEKSIYCSDPQIEAKFRALASELDKESQLTQFTTALFKIDQAIGRDPTVITQLSVQAVKQYCRASKRLVADPSGAKHVEQLKMKLADQRTDELIALTQAVGDSDDDFDLS